MRKLLLLTLFALTSLITFAGSNVTFVSCDTKVDIRGRTGSSGMTCILRGRDAKNDGLGGIYRWDTTAAIRVLPDDSFNIYRTTLTNNGVWARDTFRLISSYNELDPNVASHIKAITSGEITDWNTAYGWGNHASQGYLTNTTGDARYPQLSGSYSNPTWINSLAWTKLTGVPVAFPPDIHTHPISQITGLQDSLNTKLSVEVDGSVTNELQTLSQNNRQISISSANTITIPQATWDSILNKPSFATVATTGNYSDLIGKPTNVSTFTNDAGYLTGITSSQITTALGYTPYNGTTNPNGYVTSNNVYNAGYGVIKVGTEPNATFRVDTGAMMTAQRAADSIASIDNKINGKVANSRTITINGTTFDLSANRTWNVGTLVAADTVPLSVRVTNLFSTKTTTDLTEGSNLYFTNARSRSAISLTTTGTSGAATYNSSTGVLNIPNYNVSSFTADTASVTSTGSYNITTSSAKVSTLPTLTIPATGVWVIAVNVKLAYSGFASLTNKTVTLKLRRTNNTAADIPRTTTTFTTQAISVGTLDGTAGDCDVPTIFYATVNTNDTIELHASISASITGSMQVQDASITAWKIR